MARELKLKAFARQGAGQATIVQYGASHGVGGGAKNLSQAEFNAYERARLIADPRNGGDMEKAKTILEEAGFEVFWA